MQDEEAARASADPAISEDPGSSKTLKAIAAQAGVHVSTVSRVLRQKEPPGGWSAAALRVLKAADEVGYRPNQIAASLRTRRSKSIGLVIPRLTDVVIASICLAIESAARSAGYQVLLATPPDDMAAQLESIDFLLSRQIDGLIVTSLHLDDGAFADRLAALPVPVIATNRHIGPRIAAVVGYDEEGGRLATEHLIRLGHRRIGVVAGPRHASTARDRLNGHLRALKDHEIEVDESLIVHTEFEVEGGVVGAHYLFSLADPPTAIFAVNDTAAVGVMGAAGQRGLRIPEDLSLVGYNDIPIVAQLPTPLTTVRSPISAMGSEAVTQLLHAIAGQEVSSQRLPVSLVVRASAAAPRPSLKARQVASSSA